MKLFAAALLACFLSAVPALAAEPEYFSAKEIIIRESETPDHQDDNSVYLNVAGRCSILPWSQDLTLRGLVDQTSYKEKETGITVLRKTQPTHPVFRYSLEPQKSISFRIKPGDVILLGDPKAPTL